MMMMTTTTTTTTLSRISCIETCLGIKNIIRNLLSFSNLRELLYLAVCMLRSFMNL
jgi:hypothetical protein